MSVLIRVSIGAIGALCVALIMMAVLGAAVLESFAGLTRLNRLWSAS